MRLPVEQTVVSQFALGAALKLHPLAVLFATTAGAILFGAAGGVVAAPFLKIAIDASSQLRATGLFDAGPAAPGRVPAGPVVGTDAVSEPRAAGAPPSTPSLDLPLPHTPSSR